MNKLTLKPLSVWNGTVTLYSLPSTTSHFRLALSTAMLPGLPPKQALMFVQHTQLGQLSPHDHATDQLVLFKGVGKNDETVMGVLTRCFRCIDLWNVLNTEVLERVEVVIKSWQSEPDGANDKIAVSGMEITAGPGWIEMVRAGERMGRWYKLVEKVKARGNGKMLRVRGTAPKDEHV